MDAGRNQEVKEEKDDGWYFTSFSRFYVFILCLFLQFQVWNYNISFCWVNGFLKHLVNLYQTKKFPKILQRQLLVAKKNIWSPIVT